jgi:transposase-like protein
VSNGQLPKEANGLQLNFCKTLACDNFGLSDEECYVLQNVNPKRPAMVCRECGAFPPLLNNERVINEQRRLRKLASDGSPACKNSQCENVGLSVHTHKQEYHFFGYSGDRQRYRCKKCQGTFVDKWSGENAKITFQESLFALLFTGYSVREICRKLSINPKTFYDHLAHISSRCRRKLSAFDARWLLHADEYKLASSFTPLQTKSDNGVFWVATGEAETGYIISQCLNYSETEKPEGDLYHDPYSEQANIVSPHSVTEVNQNPAQLSQQIRARIDQKYQSILSRNNVEDPIGNMPRLNYPTKGALIRPPYTSYAHYLNLNQQLETSKNITLYMPQDPLLRSAALSVFIERINNKTIDIMYVDTDEKWRNHQKIKKIDIVHMGWWRDRWAIAEQKQFGEQSHFKGVCYLAGKNPDPQHWLSVASLGEVESYQSRMHLHFKEFIDEPRRKLRPGGILPLLDIFRAWHNLCDMDKSNQTPAMKLGLLETPLTIKQLLS